MDSGFWSVVNATKRATLQMKVLSNNLANVNSTGYKSDRIMFESFLTKPGPQMHSLPGNDAMSPFPEGTSPFGKSAAEAYAVTYPAAAETRPDLSQAPLNQTENTLDVAVQGKGFFVVKSDDGRRYTRNGAFTLNAAGELVTQRGEQVLGEGEASLVIGGSGPVSIQKNGTILNRGGQQIGRLTLVNLPDSALKKVGNALFSADQNLEQPVPEEEGSIRQGFLESSNSVTIQNMTQMIQTHRSFDQYMNMIRTLDGLDEQAVNTIGTLNG